MLTSRGTASIGDYGNGVAAPRNPVGHPTGLSSADNARTGTMNDMRKISLAALAAEQVDLAIGAGGRHSSEAMYGDHDEVLRQTVIGLVQGARLAEHDHPGVATVQVLHGRVLMRFGTQSWEARTGDLLTVPDTATAWRRWRIPLS